MNPETGVGKVMSIAEAADKVEEILEKQYDKSRTLNKASSPMGCSPKECHSS